MKKNFNSSWKIMNEIHLLLSVSFGVHEYDFVVMKKIVKKEVFF